MAAMLTDAAARDAAGPPPAGKAGSRILWCDECAGFGLRITKAGAKAWILNYRTAGVMRQLTIGSYPDWKARQAREEAKAHKRRIDRGEDPVGDRHAERPAPTVADLAVFYRQTHLPKKRPGSRDNDERALRKYVLPALGRLKVAAVRHSDIARLHSEISATHKVAGNRVVALLSKMFTIAIRERWASENPVKGIDRTPETRRERFLSPAEITRLLTALDARADQPGANVIKLLLLTGARRGEVLGAEWSQFDLDAGVWVKGTSNNSRIAMANSA